MARISGGVATSIVDELDVDDAIPPRWGQVGSGSPNPPPPASGTQMDDPTGMGDDAPAIPDADQDNRVAKASGSKKKVLRPMRTIDVVRDNRIASVPTGYFDDYVGREFEGMSYVRVFDIARTGEMNVLIEGPTGSGKTHATMAYAELRNLPYYSISSSVGIEPTQLFGKYVPDETKGDRGLVWQDGPVTDLVRHGGVLLLNELNFIPERVSTVIFSLLDRRREIQLVDHHAEVIRAHRELLIVADMNPNYEGTRPLNKALRNRFPIQLEWGYDASVEAQLVPNAGLREMFDKIRSAEETRSMSVPVATNMAIEFDRIVRATQNLPLALMLLLNHWPPHERSAVTVITNQMIGNVRIGYQKEGVL